jgi:hypothetical protein
MNRRLRTPALAMLLIATTTMTAQAQSKTFGAVLGVDFASLHGDALSKAGTKTGFMGGLFLDIPAGTSLMIEPQVLYAGQGGSDSYPNSLSQSVVQTVTLDYIEVPVLVKYSFKPQGGVYLLAGPSVNFNVTCKTTITVNGVVEESSRDCSADSLSANTTFSGVLGLGFSKGRAGIEGRYAFDFGDAVKNESTGTNEAAKNSVWAILLRITK